MSTVTTMRADEDIQRDILEELKWDARYNQRRWAVSVRNRVVTLTGGSTLSPEVGRRAGRAPVKGVVAVANDVECGCPRRTNAPTRRSPRR